MAIFAPIVLSWNGSTVTIPAGSVLRAIAVVEDVVTMHELNRFQQRGTAPLGKIAMAYGALLRFTGVLVTDDEVYQGLFSDGGADIQATIETLLVMMVPPSVVTAGGQAAAKPGKESVVNLSKRSSKSRHGKNGFVPTNSGN